MFIANVGARMSMLAFTSEVGSGSSTLDFEAFVYMLLLLDALHIGRQSFRGSTAPHYYTFYEQSNYPSWLLGTIARNVMRRLFYSCSVVT